MSAWPELRLSELLQRLVAGGVDFVVVGGIAAIAHGSPRLTQDLDICFATDPPNLRSLGTVLVDLDARLWQVAEEVPFVPDERTLGRAQILTLETRAGRLDVMTRPTGSPPYDRLRESAARLEISGLRVLVASIEDLISMKRASGRPKDLADLAELEAIKRLSAE